MRYSNPCLRLFVVILQDLHCLQRFYHNVAGVLNYTIIKISYLADLSLVRYRTVWPPLIIHGLKLFLFMLQEVHCLQNFYHDDALPPMELHNCTKFHV